MASSFKHPAADIIAALGLQGQLVTRLQITITPDPLVVVDVTRVVCPSETEELTEVLQHYELSPIETTEPSGSVCNPQ